MSMTLVLKHSLVRFSCECADTGCPHHQGTAYCLQKYAMILFRVDMADRGGTKFCVQCGDDALASGVFAPKEPS
jgi:hypothetical protein